MSAIPMAPVTITPEAAARVAELGMQAELEQTIEQVRQIVPQLRGIDVELLERYDTGGEPRVGVRAWTDLPWQEINAIQMAVARWRGASLPPRVFEHLWVGVLCGGNDAGQSIPGSGGRSSQGQ
jgi:hypothetical protein